MAGETLVTVIGNLTADPELRFTQSGQGVAGFTVASTPRVMKDGQWTDGEPLFMRCNVWRQMAENVSESLVKGARVIVHGKLKQRSFETREGERRTVVELDVEAVGPDLRYATATVRRAERATGSDGLRRDAQTDMWDRSGSTNAGADAPPF